MEPGLIIGIIVAYFAMLVLVARFSSKTADNNTFFKGDQSSKWYLVSFGMIGASLSGITFVSVTGQVSKAGFGYMQMVFGYLIGYLLVAYVLMPVYYRLNVTSIYEYLGKRLGQYSYKVGAFFFLISRFFGSSIRLLLVARILHGFVFKDILDPSYSFELTVIVSVALIWVYTNRGGIKTIVLTDALQTLFMILAAVIAFFAIAESMDLNVFQLGGEVMEHEKYVIWNDNVNSAGHWAKMLLAGALIAFSMTGLDQDMMQKNLSCKNLKDAQKNMVSFSLVLIAVNFFFLLLGGALMIYAVNNQVNIEMANGVFVPDQVFPTIAMKSEIGLVVGVFFILGLVAAAYSSADSALTSLTTSICVDFGKIKEKSEAIAQKMRRQVHVITSLIMIVLAIVLHHQLDQDALYNIFKIAGYTYGPLLGLFVFGLTTKRVLRDDRLSILICIAAPLLTYLVSIYINEIDYVMNVLTKDPGYKIGSELLGVNGLITFVLLFMFSKNPTQSESALEA